jgi:hypothetical protein
MIIKIIRIIKQDMPRMCSTLETMKANKAAVVNACPFQGLAGRCKGTCARQQENQSDIKAGKTGTPEPVQSFGKSLQPVIPGLKKA